MRVKKEINVELHYAPINLDSDIPEYYFDSVTELLGFVFSQASYEVVHLISIDENVFASHDISQITRFIKNYEDFYNDGIIVFWQEYDSYESAYRVALTMQETSVFCYTDKQ